MGNVNAFYNNWYFIIPFYDLYWSKSKDCRK